MHLVDLNQCFRFLFVRDSPHMFFWVCFLLRVPFSGWRKGTHQVGEKGHRPHNHMEGSGLSLKAPGASG